MEDKKQQIRDLLAGSNLISSERRDSILENLGKYTEDQLDKIIEILQKSKNYAPEILAEIVKRRPELARAAKYIGQARFLKASHQKEENERQAESVILEEIEAELKAIET